MIRFVTGLTALVCVAACGGAGEKGEVSVPSEKASEKTTPAKKPVPDEQQSYLIASPDGEIALTAEQENGLLRYAVTFNGEEVVGPSRLGLRFAAAPSLDQELVVTGSAVDTRDETWEQPWGENRLVRDHHNELLLDIARQDGKAHFSVRFRIFDDGLGFRYEVPAQPSVGAVDVVNELTEFVIDSDATGWWIPARKWNRYEYLYEETPVSEMPMVHTPATFRTQNGTHLSIHEAALIDYSGMSLEPRRFGGFKANLAPAHDGALAHVTAPFVTPWRTIQIAPDAPGLINSALILNLNEPNKLGDVSWVEPGKYAGIWWGMHIRENTWGSGPYHGATTENTKRYMDFAAENGFAGVLVEGWNVGWDGSWYENGDIFSFTETYPDFDLEEVAAYGLEKGVRLVGHHETSGSLTNYENQMEDAFALYEKNGVRQVKTGYVADAGDLKYISEDGLPRYEYHDGQYSVNHHIRVLEAAAKHKISINSHEPVKDTGLRRTWPNWISREGARGSEYDAWGNPPNTPAHTAIIPYTRMLSGPMDYTPGIFELRPSELPPAGEDFPRHPVESRLETTLMKQLALYVVLYSPIQMVADLPEHYDAHPEAFQFLLDVPTDWERSIALQGEVGEFAVIARQERDGEEWFLGGLTNERPRVVSVPLDFLDEGTAYRAEIYRDGPKAHYDSNPYDYVVQNKSVSSADTLRLVMKPSGGFAVRFVPQENGSSQ